VFDLDPSNSKLALGFEDFGWNPTLRENLALVTGIDCRCLNLSTSMGGTSSKVEGGDRHDLEPEGTREDT
jgi:hypothetical protein